MPIMAANGQSDARGAAWLLATTAKDCLEDPSRGPSHETALNNTYRLLESFKGGAFFSLEKRPYGRAPQGSEALTLGILSQTHLNDVSFAIRKSIATAFGSMSTEEAIATIECVLRKVAYPEKFGKAEGEPLEKSNLFFETLQNSLRMA